MSLPSGYFFHLEVSIAAQISIPLISDSISWSSAIRVCVRPFDSEICSLGAGTSAFLYADTHVDPGVDTQKAEQVLVLGGGEDRHAGHRGYRECARSDARKCLRA